jgi:hypothetical protein
MRNWGQMVCRIDRLFLDFVLVRVSRVPFPAENSVTNIHQSDGFLVSARHKSMQVDEVLVCV